MKYMAIAAAMAGLSGPGLAQCIGNCGTGMPNGVVTASPAGATYNYVATGGGEFGVGLGESLDRTGSQFTTASFTAAAGETLQLYFNYITSDGGSFFDYAYVQLLGGGTAAPVTLFTARTSRDFDTVPGAGLPLAPGVTLDPLSTAIIGGAPVWDKLGVDSGACFDTGCGYTDWIKMTYDLTKAGTYQLRFGVVNWNALDFQSGLAWNGAAIGDRPIGGVPEPGSWSMLIAGFGLVGAVSRRRHTVVAA